MSSLVVVPCGKVKIWDLHPESGSVPAKDAYQGRLFVLNRLYAEKFGDRWVILSAKYGYIEPDTEIENYNVTFGERTANCVTKALLTSQITEMKLRDYSMIIGLGGKLYRDMISENFAGCKVVFPFEGCRGIGEMMQRLKAALS